MNGRMSVDPSDFLEHVAARLDAYAAVPDEVLFELVTREGSCMVLYRLDLEPVWTGDELTDRETAAQICAGCPVRDACLELELRTSGDSALGVWGALPAEDVRALYPVWRSRRRRRGGQFGDDTDDEQLSNGESGEAGGRP
jgi:WhiB family transcriptional regulator, redox-sensing transcriptional regulator